MDNTHPLLALAAKDSSHFGLGQYIQCEKFASTVVMGGDTRQDSSDYEFTIDSNFLGLEKCDLATLQAIKTAAETRVTANDFDSGFWGYVSAICDANIKIKNNVVLGDNDAQILESAIKKFADQALAVLLVKGTQIAEEESASRPQLEAPGISLADLLLGCHPAASGQVRHVSSPREVYNHFSIPPSIENGAVRTAFSFYVRTDDLSRFRESFGVFRGETANPHADRARASMASRGLPGH